MSEPRERKRPGRDKDSLRCTIKVRLPEQMVRVLRALAGGYLGDTPDEVAAFFIKNSIHHLPEHAFLEAKERLGKGQASAG